MNVVKKAAKYYFVNIEVLREIQEINCQKKKYIYIYIYIYISKYQRERYHMNID